MLVLRNLLGALGLLIAGCGERAPLEAASKDEPAQPDAAVAAAPVDVLLDGSSLSTLDYRVDGGGMVDESQQLIRSTTGWSSFELRGNGDVICSRDGVAATRHLERAEAEALAARLRLAEFPRGTSDGGGGCADAATQTVRFGDRSMHGVCGGTDAYFRQLLRALSHEVADCAAAGMAFVGPVRVRAFSEESFGTPLATTFDEAPSWPASTPLSAALAADPHRGLLVSGEDATLLRALRAAHAAGRSVSEPTPLEQPDGSRFFFTAVDAIDEPGAR